MSKPKVQVISPREAGLPVLDSPFPVFNAEAIARADDTLKAMSASFRQWLETDVRKLQQARLDAEAHGWSDAALDQMFAVAHDIKGMGESYGYPLATEIAASLCRLIETHAGKAVVRGAPGLASAHVDAMRAVVRDRITDADDPIGRSLADALSHEVDKLGVAPR